jgi:hypothetical protein
MDKTSNSALKLGKPGAGLPFYEWFIAKYILFPQRFSSTDNAQAIANFAEESKKALELARELNPDQLCEKRLIDRLRGLEDNSRYWSVAMAIEHMTIAGSAVRGVILSLSNGKTDLPGSTIADLKPNPEISPEGLLTRFEEMTRKFVRTAEAAKIDAFPEATYSHPWFGPLNARKWLVFAGAHQSIHRKQIEQITKLLKSETRT